MGTPGGGRMDISLVVFWDSPPEWLDIKDKAHLLYRRGDILHVDSYNGKANGHPRFINAHITGVPEVATPEIMFRRITNLLTQPVAYFDVDEIVQLRKRKWRISIARLSASVISKISQDRRITVTWKQAKNFICTKTVTVATDWTVDTDVVAIMDSDL